VQEGKTGIAKCQADIPRPKCGMRSARRSLKGGRMSTSGSWDYSVTAAQIITAAAENLIIIVAGGTIKRRPDVDAAAPELHREAVAGQGGHGAGAEGAYAPAPDAVPRERPAALHDRAGVDRRAGHAQYGRTTVSSAYASGTSLSVSGVTDTTTYPRHDRQHDERRHHRRRAERRHDLMDDAASTPARRRQRFPQRLRARRAPGTSSTGSHRARSASRLRVRGALR
jgi:hypothetical protein